MSHLPPELCYLRKPPIALLVALAFNTAIAAMLTSIDFGAGFWINWLYSQAIGLTISACNTPVIELLPAGRRRNWLLVFTLPASIVLGVTLAQWITGVGSWQHPLAWQSAVIGLLFALISLVVTLQVVRIRQLAAEANEAAAERQRREAEAELKLLQAQIEPHFLFNTLANVGALIDSDPGAARQLLDRLNDWLRLTLAKARRPDATLSDELALIEKWLEILAIRFGARLGWRIEIEPAVRALPFPPMLLQPLIENAVRHGIEPKVGGGRVVIHADRRDGRLLLSVIDDGAGINNANPGNGLINVRARLAALYGSRAGLMLEENETGGVTARLEIPCAP